jgi:transcriptional regulator with PAS, ATPase and Fis domain
VRAVTVRVLRGPDNGRSVRVEQPSLVIGVGSSADFRLTDSAVSHEHLRLTLTPSGVRLRDIESKNGTFMGVSRIHEVTLTGDAAVVIGGTTLGITISTDAEGIDLALSVRHGFGDAIGQSTIMRHLFATLERAAATDLTVLLEGESGVGKDLLARAIHKTSARAAGPLVVADCSAMPEKLVESELFGHERGAFTGAEQARRGLFEEANGGTLFLDEIGELPLDLQPKLLRVLEQREVRPIGAREARSVDVRVIAATNRRLAEAARTGEFRSDLFYRLAVVKVTVPPLRERPEDILPIARRLLHAFKKDDTLDFPPDFASMLTAYEWPGNVRELRNVVERFAALGQRERLFEPAAAAALKDEEDLSGLPYHEARKLVCDRFEEKYVPGIVARAAGNLTRAAELAEVGRPTLYRMLERVGMVKR